MKKQAYQTYYRDKKGELRVQLIDAKTNKPVKNPKEYTIIDSTTGQGQGLTGEQPSSQMKGVASEMNFSDIKKKNDFRKPSATGDKRDPDKASERIKGTDANNFGFIDKPGWTKYASMIPGPVGKVALAANVGVNAKNLQAINDARESFGLKPMSTKDFMKGLVTGVDEGVVGDVDVGNGATRSIGLSDAVVDGKTTMTPGEARDRRALASVQESAARNKASPMSRLHPEIDPGFQATQSKALPKANIEMAPTNSKGFAALTNRMGVHRPNMPSSEITDKVREAAYAAYGPGTKVTITSGTEGPNNPQYGSNRHKTAKAMDFQITRPDGTIVTAADEDAKNFAETSKTMGVKGIGFGADYMGGNTFHMDTVDPGPNQDNEWGNLGNQWGQSLASAGYLGATEAQRNELHNIPTDRPGIIEQLGVSEPSTMMALDTPEAIEGYIRDAAVARNIDPDVAVAVAKSEGLQPDTYQSLVDTPKGKERSYGPFQLNIDGGLGTEFQKETGLDPTDPSTIQAQVDFALDHAAEKGWGAYHGAARVGIAEFAGLEGATPLGSTKPAAMAEPVTFEGYTKSFYADIQRQAESVAKTVGPAGDMGRIDSPSSGHPSFGAPGGSNRPASMNMGDSPSEGGSRFGGEGLSKSFGSSYSGAGGLNSPSEGAGRFGGRGLGSPSVAPSRPTNTPSEGGSRFGGLGLGTPDKDKGSQGPSGGGYGGWGGPR